ncbi:proline iminopeptidase [Stackebrandtia albiflava]|uniref:Proline iminopeptidase n=1 Tax=Stackebrandtia albiflava TaxID=406432 RepID=A0A562VCK7_9ACTN|nr:alpha/beta hydrolase [Stackebrandtia albiflava]TWJ15610.1 proline iminopeptidase [Stackebrandtia albiflava]
MPYAIGPDGNRLWTTRSQAPAGPPVVLCHGGPGLWDYLDPLVTLLPADRQLIRFDQRNCGRSAGPADYRLGTALDDLETVRRHWDVERWIVVGHSYGASLALAYAWRHPERVAGLGYLSGTGPGTDWRPRYRAERARRLGPERERRLRRLQAVETRTPAEERELRTLAWFTDHAEPETGERWAAEDAAAPWPVNEAANRELGAAVEWRAADALKHTARSRVPALFVHGDADPRPWEGARRLAGALPGAVWRLLPGTGHHPWRESPRELAVALTELLGRV